MTIQKYVPKKTVITDEKLLMIDSNKVVKEVSMNLINQRSQTWKSIAMGYIFLGFNSNVDIATNKPHLVKAQWGVQQPNGTLLIDTTSQNGFTTTLLNLINTNCELGAMIMIGGAGYAWNTAIDTAAKRTSLITAITNFVNTNNLFGVEINFEPTFTWAGVTVQDMDNMTLFIDSLCDSIHALPPHTKSGYSIYKKVSVAIAPIFNHGGTFASGSNMAQLDDLLRVGMTKTDYIMLMSYDMEFNTGDFSTSTAPYDEFRQVVSLAYDLIPNSKERLTVGIPSYSHYQTSAGNNFTPINKSSFTATFSTNLSPKVRNTKMRKTVLTTGAIANKYFKGGGELQYSDLTNNYEILESDTITLNSKRHIAENIGAKSVAVWSMTGGNPWFSIYSEPKAGEILSNIETNINTN
jgi:hypothetical protein